jgi:hypothetical protein
LRRPPKTSRSCSTSALSGATGATSWTANPTKTPLLPRSSTKTSSPSRSIAMSAPTSTAAIRRRCSRCPAREAGRSRGAHPRRQAITSAAPIFPPTSATAAPASPRSAHDGRCLEDEARRVAETGGSVMAAIEHGETFAGRGQLSLGLIDKLVQHAVSAVRPASRRLRLTAEIPPSLSARSA